MNDSEQEMLDELDKVFFSDGFRIAKKVIRKKVSEQDLLRLSKNIYEYIEELITSFYEQCNKEDYSVDCKKGCSYCCHTTVMALPYEMHYLQHYINTNLSVDQIDLIKARVVKKDEKTNKMKAQEFMQHKYACPLLQDGICVAYKARPMGCRLFLSDDKNSCLAKYEKPFDLSVYPALYEFPLRAGRMVNEGVCRYLQENNLLPVEWLMESSLNILYQNKDAISLWLKGENIFQARELTKEETDYMDKFETKN